MTEAPNAETLPIGGFLVATALFVLANGFFVAAEFALVKVRVGRIEPLAKKGNLRARTVCSMTSHLDHYLSACQLGITLASLILGWLAEPAVASLLIDGASLVGLHVAGHSWVRPISLALALAAVTLLHMVIGEQAPKMWAISRAEGTALAVAYPLKAFAAAFKPLIWLINTLSNGLARLAGLANLSHGQAGYDVHELRSILSASVQSGSITARQRLFGDNILGLFNLEVRHVMVPRNEVVSLSTASSTQENLQTIRKAGHSRFALGDPDLDHVKGQVHVRDLLSQYLDGVQPDVSHLCRQLPSVPDTQPLSRFILDLARMQTHCALVVDEHGTNIGMAFFEDAVEEIVGPIYDEFDERQDRIRTVAPGVIEMKGNVPLPDAAELLDVAFSDESDTVGGWIVATLGRLPREGDAVRVADYRATVEAIEGRRIALVRFERDSQPS